MTYQGQHISRYSIFELSVFHSKNITWRNPRDFVRVRVCETSVCIINIHYHSTLCSLLLHFYWSFLIFTYVFFVMVWRYACGQDIIIRLIVIFFRILNLVIFQARIRSKITLFAQDLQVNAELFETLKVLCSWYEDVQISPRKKLFFRVHSANKNSQTRIFAEKTPRRPFFFSARFRGNSANFRGVSPRNFAQILRENSESFKKKKR